MFSSATCFAAACVSLFCNLTFQIAKLRLKASTTRGNANESRLLEAYLSVSAVKDRHPDERFAETTASRFSWLALVLVRSVIKALTNLTSRTWRAEDNKDASTFLRLRSESSPCT